MKQSLAHFYEFGVPEIFRVSLWIAERGKDVYLKIYIYNFKKHTKTHTKKTHQKKNPKLK